jgi:hypothetical protein
MYQRNVASNGSLPPSMDSRLICNANALKNNDLLILPPHVDQALKNQGIEFHVLIFNFGLANEDLDYGA